PLVITTDHITKIISEPPNCTTWLPTLIGLPRSNTANKIIRRDRRWQDERWSTLSKLTCTCNRYIGKQQTSMASPNSGTRTLQRSLTNSGGREVVQRDHRRKIGSMRQRNCDLTSNPSPSVRLEMRVYSKHGTWVPADSPAAAARQWTRYNPIKPIRMP